MKKKQVLSDLRAALIAAKMENANFNNSASRAAFPTNPDEIDGFIKEATRLYRESWIIPRIQQAINEIEKESKNKI